MTVKLRGHFSTNKYAPEGSSHRASLCRNIDRACEIQKDWYLPAAFDNAVAEGHLALSDSTAELLAVWWEASTAQRQATAYQVLNALADDFTTALNDMALEEADKEREERDI